MEVKINSNVNEKVTEQLNAVLIELKKAKSNLYDYKNLAMAEISKAEGILETIKLLID